MMLKTVEGKIQEYLLENLGKNNLQFNDVIDAVNNKLASAYHLRPKQLSKYISIVARRNNISIERRQVSSIMRHSYSRCPA